MSNNTVHAMSVEQIGVLKASAENFGFDPGAVADVLERFGPEVLALIVEAARSGFSIQWIWDTFNKFGPTVLQFLTDLFSRNKGMAAVPVAFDVDGVGSNEGVVINGELVEGLDSNLITTLLEKFLPMILEKYGPQLIEYLIKAVLDAIKPKAGVVMSAEDKLSASLIETLLEKFLPIIMEKYGPQLIEYLIQAILKAITPKPSDSPVHTGVVLA